MFMLKLRKKLYLSKIILELDAELEEIMDFAELFVTSVKLYDMIFYPSKKSKAVGDVTFNLKKNSKSKYGYVVQSLKVHKTNKGW